MSRSLRLLALRRAGLIAACGLAFLAVACAEQSPEEKVEAQRRLYSAELTTFVVMQEPAPEPEPMEGEDGEDDLAAAGADEGTEDDAGEGEGDEMDMMEPEPTGPVLRSVLLDILVQNTGSTSLPGITVDVSQVDSAMNPKGSWKLFLELPSLAHGSSEQVSQVLEDVDFVEGDLFAVEVRGPIPPSEQSEYAEFQQ